MLLALALALADPLDALHPVARQFYARAEAEEDAGRFDSAANFYRLVVQNDPTFVPACLGLGRALEAQGKGEAAEQVYRLGPADPDVLVALATLLEPTRPVESLALWRQAQAARLGDPAPYLHESRLLVADDVSAALDAWRTYETLLQGAEPDGDTLLLLVDALYDDANRAAEALAMAEDYLARFPEGPAALPLRAKVEQAQLEAEASLVDLGRDEPLPARLVAAAAAVDAALAESRVDDALDGARALVAQAPGSSVAHGRYADALALAGRWSEAETEARVARRLAPDDATHRARLGNLLHEAYGGRRDDEALAELEAGSRLRPGDAALRYRLGVVQQAAGEFEAAAASLRAVVDSDPGGPWTRDAQDRLAALSRQPPTAADAGPAVLPPSSPEALRHWRMAVALRERGRGAEALAEIDLALQVEPASTRLHNERARLLIDAGDARAAAAAWRTSLELDPNQPDNWHNLARLATTVDERRASLRAAANLGDADAHYLLATMAREVGDWTTVTAEVAAYEAVAGATSPYREAARSLGAEADRRSRGIRVVAVSALAVAAVLPIGWWWRRRGGRTLAEVLEAAPGSWHEAARVLSGIRHEVIKHNITVLPEVARALREGDDAPWQAFASSLSAVAERADAYLVALVALARSHGHRLDVARDPDLGKLEASLRRLRRIKRPDPDELDALGRAVNEEVYASLGRQVRQICVLSVDEALVSAAYARVCAEPGFAGGELPDLAVSGGPLAVRMFRPDLDDILANLLRNALAAGTRGLAVELSHTEDEVTGHLLAEIAVVDDAPGMLSNAMIRSRFIGRGLGLAVDLVNRHGGSIRVDALGEGRKALVVQFRAVEVGDGVDE